MRVSTLCAGVALAVAMLGAGCDGGDRVILAVGTTVHDSGLLDELVPAFERTTGFDLEAVPVGTGQALEMGRRGDADVLLVHSPAAERAFVAEGYGVDRRLVMHNDFIIVGPEDDRAAVRGAGDAASALGAIAAARARFVSRGDDSGTHVLERSLWGELGTNPEGEPWYAESGQGMGATLQIASQRAAYTISDRGTFMALRGTLDLVLLHEDGSQLLNMYHVIVVNHGRSERVNEEGAAAFAAFLVSEEAQAIIGRYGVEEFGRPLFLPDAGKIEDDLLTP